MTKLSTEQQALKDSISKSALIWGVILGAVVGGIAFWALGGQSSMVQMGGAGLLGLVTLGFIKSWRTNANSAAAKCGNCNAAFSITRTDRAEEVKSSDAKESRDAQPDYSTKVVTWVEDTVEVTDTYTCAKCNDATTKQYTKTVKRDEVETIEPAPEKGKAKDEGEPKGEGEAKEAEGWFSDAAKDAAPVDGEAITSKSAPEAPQAKDGGMKKSDGGLQASPVDGVATTSKGKASGKSGGDKK